MYKTKDKTYLPVCTEEFHATDELFVRLAEKFNIETEGIDNRSYLRLSIMMLAYICQYITREELSFYFGDIFSSANIRMALSRMVKEGVLRKDHFHVKDSSSTHAYCLTQKAVDAAGALFPLECRNMVTVRRSNGVVPVHDYSAGINMLHFINSSFDFSWRKEFVFPGYRRTIRSVRVDYVVSVHGEHQKKIYIEQDMGTETIGRLIEKIACYSDHGITGEMNSCMVFSMRTVVQQPLGAHPLSIAFAKKVLDEFRTFSKKSLYAFFNAYEFSSLEEKEAMNKLMVLTGVCQAPCKYSLIRHDTELARIGQHDFTLTDMERYCKDLENARNPYRTTFMNKRQINGAFRKEISMLRVLVDFMQKERFYEDEVRVLLGGFQVFVVPTDLFGNHIRYFCGGQQCLYDVIDSYYGIESYSDVLPQFIVNNTYPAVVLRNAYLCSRRGVVCVESVNDLSALVRAFFLMMLSNTGPYSYIHFVFIIDTEDMAFELSELFGILSSNTYIDPEGVKVYFALRTDQSLRSVIKYEGETTEYELYAMKPASEKPDMKSNLSYDDVVASLFGGQL